MTVYDDLVLADSPALYFPLNDTSGSTVTALAGSNGTYVNSPTLGAAGPEVGGLDDAVTFNGSSQYAVSAAELTASTDMTIEAWVRKTSGTGLYSVISVGTSGGASQIGFDTYGVGGNNKWRCYMTGNSGGVNHLEAPDTATTVNGAWVHLVGVYTNSDTTLRLYKNGVLVGSDNTTSGTRDTGSSLQLWLGRYNSSFTQYLPGSLAGVAVYNSALSASQVQEHYLVGRSVYERLVLSDAPILYLPLNDTSGATARALTGPDGTYVNNPTLGVAGPGQVSSDGASFDGVNDYMGVTVPTLGSAQPQSWEMWVDPEKALESGGTAIRFLYGPSSTNPGFGISGHVSSTVSGEVGFVGHNLSSSSSQTYWHGATVSDVGWRHIVFTYNGTQGGWEWYIDGINATDVTWGFTKSQSSSGSLGMAGGQQWDIARQAAGPNYGKFDGAAFAVYNYELTAAQVASHFDILVLDGALHGHTADQPTLTQAHTLDAHDTVHAMSSNIVNFTGWPTSVGMIVRP